MAWGVFASGFRASRLLFNKVMEGKCQLPTFGDWHGLCDCICAGPVANRRWSRCTNEFELMALGLRKRAWGYRIKRLSACGGCLGDHRR